jgi:hypothetical protein
MLLAGCSTIRHKSFLTSSNIMGVKITTSDASGGGSFVPQATFGNSHQLVATCTPGSKIAIHVKTGSMIHEKDAYNLDATIDSSNSKPVETSKNSYKYDK